MSLDLNKINTEGRNQNTLNIDELDTIDILKKINNEDKKVALAVEKSLDQISVVVDEVVKAIKNGGRLIYMGAGTSGRVGILDAVECRPTYGVSTELVQCLMAGGASAFIKAVEGAEDNEEFALNDLKGINFNKNDILIGIAASGRTPYVISGVEYAKSLNAKTGCIVTTLNSPLAKIVDCPIEVVTGEEVITGSTRMKAGTAQKMVCNAISTSAMIKLGKVYQNLMVDVLPTNEKLVERSKKIIMDATGVGYDDANNLFNKYHNAKSAIFSEITGVKDEKEINKYLEKNEGILRKAIDEYLKR